VEEVLGWAPVLDGSVGGLAEVCPPAGGGATRIANRRKDLR